MAGVYEDRKSLAPTELVGDEFVPLPIAAAAAYYKVAGITRRLEEDQLGEAIQLMAIALSTVAPIYMASRAVGGSPFVLCSAEIEELLFRPRKCGAPSELDRLRIRKTDMERAIETLKASRSAYWDWR